MQQPPGWGPPPGYPQHGYPPHPQHQYPQGPYGPPPGWGPPQPPPKPKGGWYHDASVVAMAFFCCLPVGIVLLWTSPKFSRSAKTGWTILAALLVVTGALLKLAPSTPRGGDGSTSKAQASASASAAPAKKQVRVEWSGELVPATSRVGGRVVIDLKVKNLGTETLESFAILCSGCGGDEFQTIDVPAASVDKLFGNATYTYTRPLKPGSELTPRIVLSPNEAGNHEIRLILRGNADAEPQSAAGGFPTMAFNASVMN